MPRTDGPPSPLKTKAPVKRTQSQQQLLRHMNANNKFIMQGQRSKPMQNARNTRIGKPQAHKRIAEAQRLFRERQLQSQQQQREDRGLLHDGSFRRMIDPRKVEQFVFESQMLEYELD